MKSLKLAFAFLAVTALCSFNNPENDDTTNPESESTATTASAVQYRIQLGTFSEEAPAEILALMNKLGGVTSMDSKGKKAYLTAPFSSETEAAYELPILREKGFKNATKVVVIENHIITARTYHFFYDNKKTSAAGKNSLFKTQIKVINE